jgi:hypothetical protein
MLRPIGQFRTAKLCGRRLLAVALLMAYITTATGVPLPLGRLTRNSAELYPCAGGCCGCRSAEQCWRSCCCHTLAERLEWAREHGVQPPAYTIAAAKLSGIDVSFLACRRGAVAKMLDHSCCVARTHRALPTCCQKHLAAQPGQTCWEDRTGSRRHQSQNNFVGLQALSCQGLSMHWLAAIPPLIVAPPAFSHEPPLVVWLRPATSDAVEHISTDPAVPPPERA